MQTIFNFIKSIFLEKTLRVTWILVFLVCLLLYFFYVSFFSPSLVDIESRIVNYQMELAQSSKYRVENFLDENIRSLENLTQNLNLISDEKGKRALIERFIDDRGWFNEVTIINDKGDETLKVSQFQVANSNEYRNVSAEEQFFIPINGNVCISKVYFSDKFVPTVMISLPIKSSPDQISGVVSASFSFQEIWNIISNIVVGTGGQAYMTDSEGFIIAHRDIQRILSKKSVIDRKVVDEVINKGIQVIGIDSEYQYINEKGETVFVAGLPLKSVNWGIFIEEPTEEAWSVYNRIKIVGIIPGIVTGILLIMLVFNAMTLARVFIDFRKGRELLKLEVDRRTRELGELDRVAKLLVRRDLELNSTNNELDSKIIELENSKKSLLKALKDLEEAKNRSEEEKNKTMAVVSNFTDPIIVLDKAHNINLINPSAEKMLKIESTSMGQNISKNGNFSMENFRGVINRDYSFKKIEDKDKGTVFEEIGFKYEEQDLVYKVITVKIIGKDREYLGTMKIFYDLTREKMIDKMKSEFISIAAHQLRTPLSAIKWIIKMVLDGDAGELNQEQQDLLSKGYQSNERIITLVNDLLNVSRIEEGRFGYNFENTNFQEILNMVMEGCEKLIAKNHLKLVLNKPPQVPDVWVDKERLSLVLQNLVENSIKYTPEYGSVEIRLEIIKNKFLKVIVKDNGVGIPKEDKDKLFTKFFRASNVIRLETEGTGLGLFIAKNIVEKHGGSMSIDSEEGKGTEASFTIPLNSGK